MKLAEFLRTRQERSRHEVGVKSRLPGSMVVWIETGRFVPYDVQLARLAETLGYRGDPQDLLREVEDLLSEVPGGPAT